MELEGGCACGRVRYRLTNSPLIVHACHCRDCQRLTGSAFVINLWIERRHVAMDHGVLRVDRVAGGSGKPHDIHRCPECGTAIYSKYHAAPGDTVLLRGGTLDTPEAVTPDVHIFTRSKLPWVDLPAGARSFSGFYKLPDVWQPASLERWQANTAGKG